MPGTYDLKLVLLSLLVASLASYAALDLTARVSGSEGRAARGWLLGGAVAMGAGIWSMHFIGMLAFSLPVPLAYDFDLTMVSMAFAIVISGLALTLTSGTELRLRGLLTGGLFMGLGICAMHYTGMAAMRMSPPIRYDPLLFAASVVIAVGASLAALWLAFTLRGSVRWLAAARTLAAVVMGLAITGMHYTGMAAANFAPGAVCLASGPRALSGTSLAFWIGGVIIALLILTLLASRVDARLSRRRAQMVAQLQAANRELTREIAAREAAQRSLQESMAEQQRLAEVLQRRSEDLERSNRELEQFAYVASHDLQAPLRAISGFSQLLGRRLAQLDDASVHEYLHFMQESTSQMQQLIQALLELGRVGRNGIDLAPTDLNEALARARSALKALLDERQPVIESDPLPTVQADHRLMTQLLQNLINNAIKFQPRTPPWISIRARREQEQWIIAVSDRGIGIEPEHFRRIFQIFQRLHTSDHYEGSGVGLAICEKIVHLHGGRIWLQSTPGEGSTFYFSLPGTEMSPSA